MISCDTMRNKIHIKLTQKIRLIAPCHSPSNVNSFGICILVCELSLNTLKDSHDAAVDSSLLIAMGEDTLSLF